MKLSDAKLRALKPAVRGYKVSDGGGLHVLVTPTGGRLWRIAYRHDGKQKTLALGAYPSVSLSDARRRLSEVKAELAAGRDPSAPPPVSTDFATFFREHLATKARTLSPLYGRQLVRRADLDVLPILGPLPLEKVSSADVGRMVKRMDDRGATVLARRVLALVSEAFESAIARDLVQTNPCHRVMKAPAPTRSVSHRAYVTPDRLPAFLERLAAYEGDETTVDAILFTILTMARTSEVICMTGREIEGDLWRIPAERMKMRRDHVVPLTPAALDILSRRDRERPFPLSNNTMLYALYRMGYHSRATMHGFRRTASTAMNEHGWNRDWIEMQLAHADSSVRGIYNQALYLDGRRKMLMWWSDLVMESFKRWLT